MGCELSAGKDIECNWTEASYYIMALCSPYNPIIPENYEFEDPYGPNTPTYQHGISGEALRKAFEEMPTTYSDYLIAAKDFNDKPLDESGFNYAREFMTKCIDQKVNHIHCSY